MRTSPVYKSIERPSRVFGLELFDFFLWLVSFALWGPGRVWAIVVTICLWIGLFLLRYRRPSGFLLALARDEGLVRAEEERVETNDAALDPWRNRTFPEQLRALFGPAPVGLDVDLFALGAIDAVHLLLEVRTHDVAMLEP